MTIEPPTILIPEVIIYDAASDRDILLENVVIDADFARDERGNVIYFDFVEADEYLTERGKTLPSLPLLINAYLWACEAATDDAAAAAILKQLNTEWDRTGTTISPEGQVRHHDARLGEIVCRGLSVPQQGDGLADIYADNETFFQALLGVRNIDRLRRLAGE